MAVSPMIVARCIGAVIVVIVIIVIRAVTARGGLLQTASVVVTKEATSLLPIRVGQQAVDFVPMVVVLL